MIYTLRIDCPDRKGLIYDITRVVFNYNLNIISNDEFVDNTLNHFYMRAEVEGELQVEQVTAELYTVLPAGVNIQLLPQQKKNIVILVTKEHHCLGDLLLRYEFNDLQANILAVIGNYDVLEPLVTRFGIQFHYVTHQDKTREEHDEEIAQVVKSYQPEYIVLAKYMRVLSSGFVAQFPGRIINIHHSFLPAFIGANPYKQAYERGVKIIGATAHFVSNELDEGPIIAQNVIQVNHAHSARDMAQSGRDVEKIVLAQALKLVFADKVFISGNRTIIF
ncbi:formyltetrahydrofolate deformylase [Adhaeribacter radiodurans]|uniref:Formyltetrahydrofolate deformylase n=1 Tax=Adhaeribacter radiodurans TaxID=2745197 RepID=A0A7L7LBV1_9BACT|nr:formyltetrahydrofolate deformylase [Adhaeribacter radiodurans]QMU30301.1 formyltetrahydrofolate deformylase [Adhaeribacter radiodurans]